MDFGRTQISGLLSNVAHEKTRFLGLLHKLNTLLKLSNGNKLIVTSLDKLLLTSFPCDIYDNISYNHPIVNILKEYLSKSAECPNGSSYFLQLVKSLIQEIHYLLDNGIRPKAVSDVLKELSEIRIENLSKAEEREIDGDECNNDAIVNSTVICIIKSVVKDSHVADLLIECIKATNSFDTEKIRICKIPTGSSIDSFRVDGMILNRKPEGRVTKLSNTTVGIFNCPLDINRTELKGTVLFKNHDELLNFSKDEVYRIKSFVDSLNVNVLVVCGKVDNLFLEFANERNLMVVKAFSKFDLKRICDSVGGSIYNQLGPIKHKGTAKSISAFTDGGYDFTKIVGGDVVSTLVLKNSVKELLDKQEGEILRLLHGLANSKNDSLCESNFHNLVADFIGQNGAVRAGISKVMRGIPTEQICRSEAVRCIRYAYEFLSVILEIDDYLIARKDALDVKPPKHNEHWDEDH